MENDVVLNYKSGEFGVVYTFLQLPLDMVKIEYFDDEGNPSEILQYANKWRCIVDDKIIGHSISISGNKTSMVRSVNIWIEEKIAQIEFPILENIDYSSNTEYMKFKRISKIPDIHLSYLFQSYYKE